MSIKGMGLPDILVVALAIAAGIAVILSDYDLWFPVVAMLIVGLWLLYRYLSLWHELKTGKEAIATVVGTERQVRQLNSRLSEQTEIELFAPVVEYETMTQTMRVTYPVYRNKWFEEGKRYPIRYSVHHPWKFCFQDRPMKERLERIGMMLAMTLPSAVIYGVCLAIAYWLA
ncbi:MAG: hypothetical protein J5851_02895 [Oscillospiraceae bacterium]|nr:hypothetical protein [Oscillospiraceae bacterium]